MIAHRGIEFRLEDSSRAEMKNSDPVVVGNRISADVEIEGGHSGCIAIWRITGAHIDAQCELFAPSPKDGKDVRAMVAYLEVKEKQAKQHITSKNWLKPPFQPYGMLPTQVPGYVRLEIRRLTDPERKPDAEPYVTFTFRFKKLDVSGPPWKRLRTRTTRKDSDEQEQEEEEEEYSPSSSRNSKRARREPPIQRNPSPTNQSEADSGEESETDPLVNEFKAAKKAEKEARAKLEAELIKRKKRTETYNQLLSS
ncbi:hypothetical protein C8R43DRAFT_1108749 [Mycena crocata]|nr:hypothetical protein C8R43DRAFT_1108749 [Mycena crocata]